MSEDTATLTASGSAAVGNPWDEAAEVFAAWVAARHETATRTDGPLVRLLDALGDIADRAVLDAACGEGYLARVLAERGARVTAIDVSPRLIEVGRSRDPGGAIDFRVGDLSGPMHEFAGRFDAIGSHLALKDVSDYRGLARTLATLLRPGGRLALAFNNPYSSVVREHISNYFESGVIGVYHGMTAAFGRPMRYYHRTLEEYVDAFLATGLRLTRLIDVPPGQGRVFPYFMVLAFDRP